MAAENTALVRRKVALWYQPERADELRDLVGDGYVHHTLQGDIGIEEFVGALAYLGAAFTDPAVEIVQLVAEGDCVSAFIAWEATHSGEFAGVPPTGRRVRTTGAYFCRIAEGRVAEDWDVWGMLDLMRQIEA